MKNIACFLALLSSLVYADPCYWPDGKLAIEHTPCTSAPNSTCCSTGYACLSNHLCRYTKNAPGAPSRKYQFNRQSCTDKTFTSPECPQFCQIPKDDKQGTIGVVECEGHEDRYFCSDDMTKELKDEESCSNSSYYFEPGPIATVTVIGVPWSEATTFKSKAISSTSKTVSISTTSSTPSTTGSEAGPTNAQQSPPPTNNSMESQKLGLGLGLGLGIPLLLAIAAAVFFYRRSKPRSMEGKPYPPSASTSYPSSPHLAGGATKYEMNTSSICQEANSRTWYELGASPSRPELPVQR